jgi:methyl-accepting chemotaxis protein
VSNVLWYDNGLDVNNYRVAVTSGADDYMLYYNGSTYVTVNAGSGILLRGVTLLRDDLGYVLGDDAGVGVVYQFDGQNLTEVFRTNTSVRSVDAVSPNDIWVVGDSPMGFYHYNGFNWQHSYYPYSAGIIINVDQNLTLANIKDVVLVDAKTGYAISDNGVLLKLQSNYDQKFDALIAQVQNQSLVLGLLQYMNTTLTSMNTTLTNVSLTNQQIYNYVQAMNVTLYDIQGNVLSINQTVNNIQTSLNNMNITLLDIQNTVNSINTSVYDLTQIVTNMNNSVLANLTYIEDFLASMNATINAQLTQIIANQTYMQLYLETTMYPMINATYQNTLLILSQLGLIDYKLNQTIEIANNTLTLVNETKVGVDELVNKSRRIRAWITV